MVNNLRLLVKKDRWFGLIILTLFLSITFFNMGWYEKFEVIKYDLFIAGIGLLLVTWRTSAVNFSLKSTAVSAWHKLVLISSLVILVFAMLSGIFSIDQLNSFIGYYYRFSTSVLFITLWFIWVGIISSLDYLRHAYLLKVLLWISVLVAIYGILQCFGIGFYSGWYGSSLLVARAPSFLGNPNFSAHLVVMLLPLCWSWWQTSKKYSVKSYTLAIVTLVLIISLGLFASRGAIVGLFAASAFFIVVKLLKDKITWRKLGVTVFVSLILVVLSAGLLEFARPGSIQSVSNLNDINITSRVNVWKLAINSTKDHPWFGIGLGNFISVYERYGGVEMALENGYYDDAHNLLLQMSSTGGVPFTLAFVVLWVCAIALGLKRFWNGDRYGLSLSSGLVAFGVTALFTPVPVSVWVASGVFFGILFSDIYNFSHRLNNLGINKTISNIRFVLGVIFIVLSVMVLVGETMLISGIHAYADGKPASAINLLNIARKLHPTHQQTDLYFIAAKIANGASSEEIDSLISQMISKHPNMARSYLMAGHAYTLKFRLTKTQRDADATSEMFKKAINIHPYSQHYQLLLAQSLFMSGKIDAAKKQVDYLLVIDPGNFNGWLLRARIYQIQGSYPGVISALEHASVLMPDVLEVQRPLEQIKFNIPIEKLDIKVINLLGNI